MALKLGKFFIVFILTILLVSTGFAYTNWASGEPNEINPDEDCGELYDDGTWNDIPCTRSHQGLCEMPDGSFETTSSTTWSNARTECQNRGGYLAVINTPAENSIVASNHGNVWMGYYQKSSGTEPAGGWTWVRNNTLEAELSGLSSEVIDADGDGTYVMGREVKTKFNYTANSDTAQVAFAVDETYSMGPVMEGVKDNIKWFYKQLGASAEGTVIGSGCGSSSGDYGDADSYHCLDRPWPGDNYGSGEPRDLAVGQGLISNENDLVDAADNLEERTSFEGPDSSVAEAVGYGGEASDYTGSTGDYGDEAYDWGIGGSKAVIWIQDGGAGYGSCSGISDFSGGMGSYMKRNNFTFYAIVRDLSGCRSNYETAATETGGQVYDLSSSPTNADWQDILGDISQSINSEADLTSVVASESISEDNYDSEGTYGGHKTYEYNDINTSDGQHSIALNWWPTDYGTMDVKTGDSFITLAGPTTTTTHDYSSSLRTDVKYVDLAIENANVTRKSGGIYLNFTLANNGNTASKSRDLEIYDEDGNYLVRTISSIGPNSEVQRNFTIPSNHNVFQDPDRITAHFDRRGKFNSLSVGEGEILEPDETNNIRQLGYPPRLSSTSPSEVNWNDTFRFGLDFDHYYPDQVQGNYTVLEDGNKIRDEASYSKPAEGTLRTNQIDNDESRIYYNITSKIRGPQGAVSVYNHTFYVSNPRPEIYAAEPKNLNSVYQNPVQLRAFVDDENNIENSNGLNVSIYDQETGNLLKRVEGVAPRTPVSYSWSEADEEGKTYRWNVTVSDDWDTVSEVFRFVKGSRVSYRTETESNYSYSGVVTSSGGQGAFRYSVRNRLEFDKNNMRTMLSGVNARFESTGTDTKDYALPKESSKTFNIIVNPGNSLEGQQYLTVTTTNEDLGINNTDKIPIFVRSDAKRSRGVPGLSILNILFMVLASTLYFAGSH